MFEIGNLANHCFRTLLIDIGSRDDKSRIEPDICNYLWVVLFVQCR